MNHDPLEAARRLGHDHGIATIARKLGRNPQVLSHQLNPEAEQHHLGLATAIAMTELTNNECILESWAALRGKVLVALPAGTASEEELLDDVLGLDSLHGDFAKQLIEARKDGVIDSKEYDVLVLLLRRVIQRAANLEKGIGSQVRDRPVAIAGKASNG